MTGGARSDEKGNSGWYRARYVSGTNQGLLERGKTGEKRMYKYKEGNICYHLIKSQLASAVLRKDFFRLLHIIKYPRIIQPTALIEG